MSYEIMVTAQAPVNEDRLLAELAALAVPGVRSYSIIGAPGYAAGVYPWAADAPAGEYHHIELPADQVTRVRAAIEAHESVNLDEYKASKIAALNASCGAAIIAGFTSGTTGHRYAFEIHDQLNLIGQHTLFVANPAKTEAPWPTLDAGVVVHTREQFLALGPEAEDHKRSKMEHYRSLKAQVEAAATRAEVDAITWS